MLYVAASNGGGSCSVLVLIRVAAVMGEGRDFVACIVGSSFLK